MPPVNQPGPFKSLDDWLAWLETRSPREIVLGLERVQQVLERLKLRRPRRVIHIAGTNGKGSSVAILEAMLLSSGDRVGSYTSPHLRFYNERIRVAGEQVSDADLIAAFERIERVRDALPLTYFEFSTLAAMVIFEARNAETVILEVGMGGRLDAVNAIEPDASIITNVSLDHCDWLGTDVESIAAEKAGIMRAGERVIFVSESMPDAIAKTAATLDADLRALGRDFGFRLDDKKSTWNWYGRNSQLQQLPQPLRAASIQVQNAAGVLALLEALDILSELDKSILDAAIRELEVPGRLQWVVAGREWVLDVAHNAESTRVLGESLSRYAAGRKIIAVIGAMSDKNAAALAEPLSPWIEQWIAVTAAGPRATEAGDLAAQIANVCNKPCLICDDLPRAMRIADRRAGTEGLVLVTGSFYVVGPALDELYSRRDGGAVSCSN